MPEDIKDEEVEKTDEELDAEIEAALAEEAKARETTKEEPAKAEEEEEEEFDVDAAALRRIMSIEDPAKRKAAVEQLAKAEGLELKLPEETKDEQEVAQKAGEKKITRLTAQQIVKDLEAGGVEVDLTEEEIGTVDGMATLMAAHSQMQQDKSRAEIRQEVEDQKAQEQAVAQFEDWKKTSASQLAEEHGNAEAASAVYEEFKDMTPQEVQATMESPRLAKLMDDRIAQIVKGFTVDTLQDEPPPKSEEAGLKPSGIEPSGINKRLHDQLANDPDFADDKEFLTQVKSR